LEFGYTKLQLASRREPKQERLENRCRRA
jgi:hypothetical protein